jgi:hypothetical protein
MAMTTRCTRSLRQPQPARMLCPYVTFHRPLALTPAVLPAKWSNGMETKRGRAERQQRNMHRTHGAPALLKSTRLGPALLTSSRGCSAASQRHILHAALTCHHSRRVRCSPD